MLEYLLLVNEVHDTAWSNYAILQNEDEIFEVMLGTNALYYRGDKLDVWDVASCSSATGVVCCGNLILVRCREEIYRVIDNCELIPCPVITLK